MLNILRRELGRNGVFLAAVTLVLSIFEFLLCAMVASVDVETAFNQISALAPPLFRAIIEENMPGGSPAAVLSFGWNHPVVHALLTAVAITLPTRAIAGEVENGAIELVAAQPVSRAAYFGAHLLFGLAALAAVIGGGLAATRIGQAVYSLQPFPAGRLSALFVNALLLQLAIYALTLAVSAFGREAGRVALAAVLLAVLSFLVHAVATLWSKAAFAKPYSLHAYYQPRDILTQGDLPAASFVVLAAFAAAALTVAFLRFTRRDLP